MTQRFEDLKKIPQKAAGEFLAASDAALDDAGGIALNRSVGDVLADLDARGNLTDQIRLLARSLPKREAVWWACLAGRDLQPDGAAWATLKVAEDWVYKPGPETRQRCFDVVNDADPDEESDLCARAAYFAEPEEEEIWVQPGFTPMMAELMNIKSMLDVPAEAMEVWARHLIDRGLDIARGGNGAVAAPALPEASADAFAEDGDEDVAEPAVAPMAAMAAVQDPAASPVGAVPDPAAEKV
ncbi:MAG: hypothetical protein AAGC92_07335 [Pseudomonadota bacterium]